MLLLLLLLMMMEVVMCLFTDINDCAGQPCENGGICRDLDGDFKCHCPSPYVGKHCQLRKCDPLTAASEPLIQAKFPLSAKCFSFHVAAVTILLPHPGRRHTQGPISNTPDVFQVDKS